MANLLQLRQPNGLLEFRDANGHTGWPMADDTNHDMDDGMDDSLFKPDLLDNYANNELKMRFSYVT